MQSDNDLLKLRSEIDEIDRELSQLLAERNDVCLHIAETKRTLGLPLENTMREDEVIAKCCTHFPEYAQEMEACFRQIIAQSKKIQRKALNLYLVGMPNCGKTKLASRLGKALSKECVDTDDVIMKRSGKSIDEIFDKYGEDCFRQFEHEAIKNCAHIGGLIVATGGGVLTYEANIPIIRNSGIVVFLDRDIKKLLYAKSENRPLIRGGKRDVYKLYDERIGVYRSCADVTVDPDASNAVDTIVEFYNKVIDGSLTRQ